MAIKLGEKKIVKEMYPIFDSLSSNQREWHAILSVYEFPLSVLVFIKKPHQFCIFTPSRNLTTKCTLSYIVEV